LGWVGGGGEAFGGTGKGRMEGTEHLDPETGNSSSSCHPCLKDP